jgi:hypothetical protein
MWRSCASRRRSSEPTRRRDKAIVRVLAARCARAMHEQCPSKTRGRRESRVRAAPAVSCAIGTRKSAHEHTGSAEAVRPSLRNGFNGFLRALPGDRLSCHRRRQDSSRPLDASTGASGPHDFAVRAGIIRPHARARLMQSRPPHPIPTFVTMANAPLAGPDGRGHEGDLHRM